jgi:signal transduction histidine kinase
VFAVLVGACLVLVALAGVGAHHMVTRALRPVSDISDRLAEISATDLGRLQVSMEQQRQFASDASHDLRSPITAMRAEVEDAMLVPEETDVTAIGRSMLISLDRLQAIVSDLLMLARLDSGVTAARERIDLGELVGEELDRRKRCVEVTRKLEPGVVVIGDRLRLARLLTNLADNAERHAASRITVSVTEQNDMAVLEVVDDGAGIASEQREVVFRRFTRLDAARNKDAGGTGLGLPIAREIAEAHGGSLKAEDGAQGARFVLRIPLTR